MSYSEHPISSFANAIAFSERAAESVIAPDEHALYVVCRQDASGLKAYYRTTGKNQTAIANLSAALAQAMSSHLEFSLIVQEAARIFRSSQKNK